MQVKKIIVLLVIIFIWNGCVTSPKKPTTDVKIAKQPTIEEQFITLTVKNLEKLSLGMTKKEALEAMRSGLSGFPDWLYTLNPFRSETLKIKGKRLDVVYYYIKMKGREGIADNEELIPLVFEKEKLRCWGWGCLQ